MTRSSKNLVKFLKAKIVDRKITDLWKMNDKGKTKSKKIIQMELFLSFFTTPAKKKLIFNNKTGQRP